MAPWKRVAKNGDEIPHGAEVEVLDNTEAKYISRGGLKLEGALKVTGLDVTGLRCLDIGQSTGGFTDCLLQHGAEQVVGVDVGHGQLHATMRADARVVCIEGVNARSLTAVDLAEHYRRAVYLKNGDESGGDSVAASRADHRCGGGVAFHDPPGAAEQGGAPASTRTFRDGARAAADGKSRTWFGRRAAHVEHLRRLAAARE